MFSKFRVWLSLMAVLVVAACGGGGGGGDPFTQQSQSEDDLLAASITTLTLLVSSPQLGSSGTDTVTVTAIAKDANNILVEAVDVNFSADSGALSDGKVETDASGQAVATLSTGGNKTNRTITITAIAGNLTTTNTVDVTGTALAISGESSLTLADSTTLTIALTDSDGVAIASEVVTITSSNGNTLSSSSVTTDTAGLISVDVTAATSGADTITVTALGATATFALTVSGDQFSITAPTANKEINLTDVETVSVTWLSNGTPKVGETVNFIATRGTLSATTATTNASGVASVTISSTNAGPSVITAYVTSGPSTSVEVEFVATTPSSIALQADKTTIGPNDGSETEKQQAKLTAIVRDSNGNLVKNKTIRFTITADNTGGTLTNATATTDSLGKGTANYVSSAATSAADGVTIRAQVEGTAISTTLKLTVAQKKLFVRVEGSHLLTIFSNVRYEKEFDASITDSAGNAVAGATVTARLLPTRFYKGTRVWNGTAWAANYTATCANEDVDLDGILDTGEDTNSDGFLTPGNFASVVASATSDANGFATLAVQYVKNVADWMEVILVVTTEVSGTESQTSKTFTLPVASGDVDAQAETPPGATSPFGSSASCADTL